MERNCECGPNGSDVYPGEFHSGPYNHYDYSHLNSFWYQQLWSHYRPQTSNPFPTWCSTCVEEREQRQKRNERMTCDDMNCFERYFSSARSGEEGARRHRETAPNNNVPSYSVAVTCRQCSEEDVSDCGDSSSEEFEMELNNDFKKFLEQSAKHKEQREKEARLSQVETEDYIEAGEIALEATTEAPTQEQSIVRREEMKKLYGKSAHLIESLETSLQLHFNMNVDMRHPVFWPSIPLKF